MPKARTPTTISARKTRQRKSDTKTRDVKISDIKNSDLDKALAGYHQAQLEKDKLKIKDIRELRKKFKLTCDETKKGTQLLCHKVSKRKAGTTRSGATRGKTQQALYTNGKWVNTGIDDSQDLFDKSEQEFLKKAITRFNEVKELKFEHIKYLVMNVFMDELKGIKEGKINAKFHDRYMELSEQGKATTELFSEMCTSLFTNEQRDYISGLLQGAFDTTTKDDKGDIKHKDIHYVNIVMLAEITTRIVAYVHDLKSTDEAIDYMRRSAREALNLDADD